MMMDSTTLVMIVGVFISGLVGYFSIVYLFDPKYDPKEPPVLSHYIPFVGHIAGMIWHGQDYFNILRFVSRAVWKFIKTLSLG